MVNRCRSGWLVRSTLAGAGVARGYLNRPELTAERFVADPFSTAADARMYRTGDLGRWRSDGNIEFLGRNDFQVKIRGFRIELGEIEARAAACAGVREAVVVAREDEPGDKRLVAYVTAQAGAELSAAQLRSELSSVLPEYMIPSAFVRLEALPLTPNGKLDRKGLPAPDQTSVASAAYEAPVGEMESAIARIWQELLQLERVGRHDNFFELGGHSLLAVRLVSRLRQQFGVEVALREVFAQPTLQGVAQAVLIGEPIGAARSAAGRSQRAPTALLGAATPVVPGSARSRRRCGLSPAGRIASAGQAGPSRPAGHARCDRGAPRGVAHELCPGR